MPIQLLIHGCVLTLLSVLSLHLIFTAKYHYPLARTNFLLLLSAVILTIISTIVVVAVINHALFNRSRFWPFMFDYVEVPMPPPDWKPLALVGWYIMQSAVTFLAHVGLNLSSLIFFSVSLFSVFDHFNTTQRTGHPHLHFIHLLSYHLIPNHDPDSVFNLIPSHRPLTSNSSLSSSPLLSNANSSLPFLDHSVSLPQQCTSPIFSKTLTYKI